MQDSTKVAIAVSLGVAFAVALATPLVFVGRAGTAGVQNGQFLGGMMGMMSTQGQTIPLEQAVSMMKDVPVYASITPANNTIIFGSKDVKLVVLATDLKGASNLTNNVPPSYATDNVFVIYGLVNPTLEVPQGTTLQVVFVNLDTDMYHNFVMSSLGPPYPYMAMQGMMYWQQGQGPWVVMAPFLPPASQNPGVVHEYSYTSTVGSQGISWYLCTYPGHAQMGMYGEVIVK